LAETIEESIRQIADGNAVEINSWKDTAVGGRFIITAICEAIDYRDVFISDLTYLNHNVLFELGYAIAKDKRVWLLHNPDIEDASIDFNNFKILTTVGFVPYANSQNIAKKFYEERPFESLSQTIYKEAILPYIRTSTADKLLYLKSEKQTEASIKLSRLVDGSTIPNIVDDPGEVRIQTLSWYAEKVSDSFAVIAHLLSRTYSGWRLHNAKISFISGLAYGLGKHLLMLAHAPYDSPIDYRDLLCVHETASGCEKLASGWLSTIETKYRERKTKTDDYAKQVKATTRLQHITIGDPVAEHESENLLEYFVATSAYNEALSYKQSIFIGRKGTGKTAILYKLSDELRTDPRNHVCEIIPIGYELDGVIFMIEQALQKSEKGFLMESFWKFLIYTELAKSLYQKIIDRPLHYQPNANEEELVSFVQANSQIVTPEFSVRLETVVASLQNVADLNTAQQQRLRISELLHNHIIAQLRQILGRVLEHKNRVSILMDNLDKAWNAQHKNIIILCDLLYALMQVSRDISDDFKRTSSKLRPVNLSIIIFLRSDIFQRVMEFAPERDKLYFSRLVWDDQEVLLNVLEQRFLSSSKDVTTPRDVWTQYFCPNVTDTPIKKYLTEYIIPRPRDLIYLVRIALTLAVNRHHTIITEDDIRDAQYQYSQYALDSLDTENSLQLEHLKELLYEFIGANRIVDTADVLRFMGRCEIPERKLDEVLDLLCKLTFLGMEVETDRFEFLRREEDETKFRIMARRVKELNRNRPQRFLIAKPFYSYLEVR